MLIRGHWTALLNARRVLTSCSRNALRAPLRTALSLWQPPMTHQLATWTRQLDQQVVQGVYRSEEVHWSSVGEELRQNVTMRRLQYSQRWFRNRWNQQMEVCLDKAVESGVCTLSNWANCNYQKQGVLKPHQIGVFFDLKIEFWNERPHSRAYFDWSYSSGIARYSLESQTPR